MKRAVRGTSKAVPAWTRWLHWRGLLFLLGVGLAAASADSRSAAAQEARYPAWFHAMPQSGQSLWAVGYARGYSTLAAGVDSAKADAYTRLRRDRRVTVWGEKLYESTPGLQLSFEGARFTETGLPDTLRSVRRLGTGGRHDARPCGLAPRGRIAERTAPRDGSSLPGDAASLGPGRTPRDQ